MHALLVAEDFAGMHAQGRGLAERAGLSWAFFAVERPTGWARLRPEAFLRAQGAKAREAAQGADLIISVGGRGGAVGHLLGKQSGLPVVQVQNPRRNYQDYALIIANVHDGLKRQGRGENVLEVRTALHDMTPERLEHAAERWRERLRGPQKKLLGILLGGPNGRYRFGEREAAGLAEHIRAFLNQTPMACVLTPSRRTCPRALAVLVAGLQGTGARVVQGEGEENPYRGVLGCADLLAVTTDSVSMLSEAVATTAPVGVLTLPGHSKRITSFVELLKSSGRIQDFRDFGNMSFLTPVQERVDDTTLAAREMMFRLNRACLNTAYQSRNAQAQGM